MLSCDIAKKDLLQSYCRKTYQRVNVFIVPIDFLEESYEHESMLVLLSNVRRGSKGPSASPSAAGVWYWGRTVGMPDSVVCAARLDLVSLTSLYPDSELEFMLGLTSWGISGKTAALTPTGGAWDMVSL